MKKCLLDKIERPDDVKSVSGKLYVAIKNALSLKHAGNNQKAFMRDTLAPLLTPETETYKKLKSCIFER